jgi:DNA polymerase III sliding clamp (beta) subunit (PCNA family)
MFARVDKPLLISIIVLLLGGLIIFGSAALGVLAVNEVKFYAVIKGDDLTISFNYKYIIDCFQSIHSDSISMQFSGLGKPVLVSGVSDKSFLYIVMPMNK